MKKRYYVIILLVLAAIAVALILQIVSIRREQSDGEGLEELRDMIKIYETTVTTKADDTTAEVEVTTAVPETTAAPSEPVTEPPPEITAETTTEAVTEPVKAPAATLDFTSLHEMNPDICAWIEIDGTKVDYPVLQNAKNDSKYLTTAFDGTYSIGGSLFTQATYNSNDFNDPVTVIYGHTMRSGTLFGQLQPVYTDPEAFEEHREITLYLPGEVRSYTVFAAVPYESIHILHTYDFSNEYWYNTFFKNVREIRAIGANIDDDIIPQPGDRVIILSTCLNEDSTKRFLVMAVLSEDLNS